MHISKLKIISLCIFAICFFAFLSLPSVKKLDTCFVTSMNQVPFCKKNNGYVVINRIPKNFITALLISEDASFYTHSGFDFSEIKNSIITNLKSGKKKRGASTISQQLVKNIFLSKKKSYFRKIKEALITLSLENSYTKDQILEFYLNVVEFGDGIYGIKSAANYYFQKPVELLNLVESAFLIQLLPNPKNRSKGFFKEDLETNVLDRIKYILFKLEKYHKISEEDYKNALYQLQMSPWNDDSNLQNIFDSPEFEETDLEEDNLSEDMYKEY